MKSFKVLVVIASFTVIAAPMYPAAAPLIHNSIKYRDAGAKPATGRSGSAAIEARALRGKTQTDIEVTTGQLDGIATPPGKLDKVQLKVYAGNGNLLVTDNYRKSLLSGGSGDFEYDWVTRGQSVQVQANVSGIDPTRNDVVTVSTPVKWRPDITISNLQKPNTARVNAGVVVSATLRELNGDVGARANCVLKVDGVAVDRANGIWIDAGDSVACEFAHHFDSTGVKQLTVEAADVVPADYDTANNSVTGSLEVVGAGVPVRYLIGASDGTMESTNGTRHLDTWHFPDNPDFDSTYESTSETDGSDHIVSYQATMNFEARVTFPLRVESSVTSDGHIAVQDAQDLVVTTSYGNASSQTQCGATLPDYNNPRSFQVCTTQTYDGLWHSSVNTWTQSRLTTYYSTMMAVYRALDEEDVYTFSDYQSYPFGPQPVPSLGNHIAIQAAVIDAGGINDINAAVDLIAYDFVTPFTEECTTWDEPYDTPVGMARYSGYDCYSYSFHTFGRQGFAQGIDNQ
jgi:hypothetical protein